jgi:DNA-binding XRE family transcriptional regulator
MLGISRQAMSQLEMGKTIPRLQTAVKLCVIYRCKFETLVSGEEWFNNFTKKEGKKNEVC